MRISTRTRYGSRALVELATAYPERAVSVREVAEIQHISVKYLEHIMTTLKAAGLIKAVRGMHGGHMLTRSPSSINLSDVFSALEGPPTLVDCVDYPNSCPMEAVCPTQDTWIQVGQSIAEILERTTLQDLIERKQRKSAAHAQMYHI